MFKKRVKLHNNFHRNGTDEIFVLKIIEMLHYSAESRNFAQLYRLI